MKNKKCSICKMDKELKEFSPNKSKRSGISSYCKPCKSVYGKKWNKENQEKKRIYNKQRYSDCREQIREKQNIWYKNNSEKHCDNNWKAKIKRNYGLSIEDYNNLYLKQEGKCKICERHQDDFKKRLSVDHCHKTGKIRGLLCDDCNTSLGKFRDDLKTLSNALKYLEETYVKI